MMEQLKVILVDVFDEEIGCPKIYQKFRM